MNASRKSENVCSKCKENPYCFLSVSFPIFLKIYLQTESESVKYGQFISG